MASKNLNKFTKAQKKWLKDYEEVTGFEPMFDVADDFNEIAQRSFIWFRNHCEYQVNAIEHIPYDDNDRELKGEHNE